MSVIKFYNRERELNLLTRVKKPFFAVIYGRRRVGKTFLALKYTKDKNFMYFFVNKRKNEKLLLEEFFSQVKEKLKLPEYIRPSNWEELFKLIFDRFNGIVIIDEFQWFLDVNREVPFILQKLLNFPRKSSLLITGSVIGMMKKLFIKEGAPLFKRGDVIIKLKPLDIKTVFKILADLGIGDLENKFKIYMIFGGIPYYYSLMFKLEIKNFDEILDIICLNNLKREVEETLEESFGKDYKTHMAILYAIGMGKTKLKEICSIAGIKETSVMPYIYDLKDMLEVLEQKKYFKKRKKYYVIKDFFFRFWFRYVFKNLSALEVDKKRVLSGIKEDLNNYFGLNFEDVSKEILYSKNLLPFDVDRIEKFLGYKREHGKRIQFDLDLIALNEKMRRIAFFECKWHEFKKEKEVRKIINELKEKSKFVSWHDEERKVYFGIIGKRIDGRIKRKLRKEGYLVYDLKDVGKMK